ncbi:MAG TPA: tautomerase family protein [Abditibacteriaceae bacterium]|jgi:phenylpyruvate tautomerase PptA (4-oxalocrotonate tautomerase family)
MAQIKIYGLKEQLEPRRETLSDVIHSCAVDALGLPPDKRFHRFIALEKADFIFPSGRSDDYTIIEISMFKGRSTMAKKRLINLLFERLNAHLGIAVDDIEITIFETPKKNWGIRGKPGDELELSYSVTV